MDELQSERGFLFSGPVCVCYHDFLGGLRWIIITVFGAELSLSSRDQKWKFKVLAEPWPPEALGKPIFCLVLFPEVSVSPRLFLHQTDPSLPAESHRVILPLLCFLRVLSKFLWLLGRHLWLSLWWRLCQQCVPELASHAYTLPALRPDFCQVHRLWGFDLDVSRVMDHHSVHTAFNLLELERLISKMVMTKKISFVKFGEEKVKYNSHSNILQNHKHGFSSISLIAVAINSAPTACCPLEVSPMYSKVHWLSCEVWHPHVLYKCPCLLPLLCTKAGRAECAWVLAGDAPRAVSIAFHGEIYCSLPTKTADWKNCWLLPHASPPVNCEKSQKPQMEVLKCHYVPFPSTSTNSHELLTRHKDTLFNWQVTSVRFMDLSKIWSITNGRGSPLMKAWGHMSIREALNLCDEQIWTSR